MEYRARQAILSSCLAVQVTRCGSFKNYMYLSNFDFISLILTQISQCLGHSLWIQSAIIELQSKHHISCSCGCSCPSVGSTEIVCTFCSIQPILHPITSAA
jgi:hypothetical protein